MKPVADPATPPAGRPRLLEFDQAGLVAWFDSLGEPAYRAHQVYRWLYQAGVTDFAGMTDLPAALRARLTAACDLGLLTPAASQQSADGLTRKVLFTLHDGQQIEAVLMSYPEAEQQRRPSSRPGEKPSHRRRTVCVSTQVGCAMGCTFCATGQMGLGRNLSAGEIVAQVIHFVGELRAARVASPPITNVIFAGMGEPLANYDATLAAVRRLNDPAGLNIGARHITVSTVGLVPGIERLAGEPLQVHLAVSLHAPDDRLRTQLMPVNRRYPLASLLRACRSYVDKTGRRVSFEYVLLAGVNDRPEQAHQLAQVLGDLTSHVNLIPANPIPGGPYRRPERAAALAFQQILTAHNIPTTIRVERGSEIAAACGQLRAAHDRPQQEPVKTANKPSRTDIHKTCLDREIEPF